MPRQEPLFTGGLDIPPQQVVRDGDPTAPATFVTTADRLVVGDVMAVLGRLERITALTKDAGGNLRVATVRTGKRAGYFKFPADQVRIVPRDRRTPWQR